MARRVNQAILIILLCSLPFHAVGKNFAGEVPDEQALEAFKAFWSAFDAYEQQSLKDGKKDYQKKWEAAKSEYLQQKKQLEVQELSALYKASENYKTHLAKHPDAANRPFVLLNLAQVLNMIGDHLAESDQNASVFSKSEALSVLNEVIQNYTTFADVEKAHYLRAVVLASLDREGEAHEAWQALAATGGRTIYSVHANIAVGDYWFDREQSGTALRAYQNGLQTLQKIEVEGQEYESIRLQYRIAWAAYRAGELTQVISSATSLLQPGQTVPSIDKTSKIQLDAIDLLGDALYENNSMADTIRVLGDKDIHRFAAAAGLRTLRRYNGQGIHNEAITVGAYLAKSFPLTAEAPDIHVITADSYNKLGREGQRIAHLEKLAMLLPQRSLWRAQLKGRYEVIKNMESLAEPAAAIAADWHYARGKDTGNPRASLAGASLYEILVSFQPNGDESNKWRLRRADCNFHANKFDEAALMYRALKSRFQVKPEILQAASYQLVRVEEKRWLASYQRAVESGKPPPEQDDVLQSLRELEKSIDEYAARFPHQKRSVDLLLRGASANRDMKRFDQASRYWQRVLVSQPDPAQRGVAVRGLVLANMKLGSTGDVVEVTRRFLKLEDWKALGLNLGDELKGVLAVAALDEGKRLNDNGRVKEAGALLTEIAKEFNGLPNRDRIFRDGTYMLAIAGDWGEAQAAAESYLASGLTENRGDMVYLLARANHYQLRLKDAAKNYLQVGKSYPRHSRAMISLERAEKLATAEGMHGIAAEASALLAERSSDTQGRMVHYATAIRHLGNAGDPERALTIARKRLQSAKGLAERLDARMMVALATFQMGPSYEQEALDDLAVLGRTIERNRNNLDREEYAELSGQAYFHLGEEARRRFEDFKISNRAGAESAKVTTKLQYFEEMTDHYNKSANAGSPTWAPRSRYMTARAAEELADEIASLDAKRQTGDRYRTTVERLRALAKNFYSTNVLTAKRNPKLYSDNEWVQKSSAKLSIFDKSTPSGGYSEIIPDATSPDMPSQWSL